MPAKKASISINLLADATKAKAGFAEAEKAAGGLDKQFGNIAKTAVNAFATREIINFGKGAVGAASDLAESANAVSVSFGDAADRILKLGENASTAVGLSAKDFNGFAVQFAGFTRQLTTADKDIVDVTDELTVRIADFASVMNLDVPDAATKFQSALAGSTEPMRAFGIDVSAAAVQTYALENGITSNAAAMTEAEKVQARYGLIMEQTAQMSGDFANTSDGLANSQRILAAEMENIKATVGAALVPALQGIMGAVSPVLEAFTALPKGMQQLIVLSTAGAFGFRTFSNTMQGFGMSAKTANKFVGTLGTTMAAATIIFNEYTTAQNEIKAAGDRVEQTLNNQTKAIEYGTKAGVKQLFMTDELGKAMEMLGLDVDLATEAVLGNDEAAYQFIDTINNVDDELVGLGDGFKSLFTDEMKNIDAVRIVRREYQGMRQSMDDARAEAGRLNDTVIDGTDYLGSFTAEQRRFNDIIKQAELDALIEDLQEVTIGMDDLRGATFKTDVEMSRLFGRLDDDQAVADFIRDMQDANDVMKTNSEQGSRDLLFALEDLMEAHSLVDAEFAKELLPLVEQGDIDATLEKFEELLSLIGQIPADIQLAIDAGSLGLSIAELEKLPSTVYGLGRQLGAQDGLTANFYISAGVITDPVEVGKTMVEAINEYYAIGGAPIGGSTNL
jgi:hypothetical protein